MTQVFKTGAAGLVALLVVLQATASDGFPDGATTPDAAAVQQHVTGKAFKFGLPNGGWARLQYRDGDYFLDTSSGHHAQGSWRTQDGQLCGTLAGRDEVCSQVRLVGDQMYLRRASSGEVVKLAVD
jgi:hypothetical protein